MPADLAARGLYEDDVVLWSDRQAELLRRLEAGERVNEEVDWSNVIEEIESVGRSELHSAESHLARALEHLLKIHGWPSGPVKHWNDEAFAFLLNARRCWAPSMGRRIDLAAVYEDARTKVARQTFRGAEPRPMPTVCPYSLADLIVPRPGTPDIDSLLAKLHV